jgi:hypothetical protein
LPAAEPAAAPAGATTGPDGLAAAAATVPAPAAPRSLANAALAFGNALADQGTGGRAPAPPLPDDAAVSAAAGRPVARDAAATQHPAALAGGSALYRAGDGGHVQVVWVPAVAIDVYRRLPAALRHELPGLGDEAYRARFGGGVMARRGDHVVMVMPHLPAVDASQRDDVAARVAGAALDQVVAGPPPAPPAARSAPGT